MDTDSDPLLAAIAAAQAAEAVQAVKVEIVDEAATVSEGAPAVEMAGLSESTSVNSEAAARQKDRTWITGLVGHLSIYTLMVDAGDAVLQCLVYQTVENDRVVPRILIFTVPLPREGTEKTYLFRKYASIIVSSLASSAAGTNRVADDVREEDDECGVHISRRSNALAQLLLCDDHRLGFHLLANSFHPVEILTDGLCVLEVRRWRGGNAAGLLQSVAACSVGRIRAIGAYHADAIPTAPTDDAVPSTSTSDLTSIGPDVFGRYRTHANKKLCRGLTARALVFSVRVGTRKFIFEDGAGGRRSPIRDLFEIRDVRWRHPVAGMQKLRLCIPRGFIAFVFSDDQCLLLLRDAIQKIFKLAYAGFSGLFPFFDFLGPNMLRLGGPRSIFLPGFPCVPVYSVPWPYDASLENGADAVNHVRALQGLPDIVGSSGKLAITLSPGNAVDASNVARFVEIDMFYKDFSAFRVNARWCSLQDVGNLGLGDGDSRSAYIYVGDGGLCRVSVLEMRLAILRRCLPGEEFPFVLIDTARRLDRSAVTNFIARLRHRSPGVFRRIRSFENYFSKVLTDACDKAGFAWVLVRNDCEVYARRRRRSDHLALENAVRCAFIEAWHENFGQQFEPPPCRVSYVSGGVLVATDKYVISGFADEQRDHWTPGWIASAGRLLSEAVYCTFEAADWSARDFVIRCMATHMLRLSTRRHETRFWLQRFSPGRNPVEEHLGIQDATEFCGVRVKGGMVAVQPADGALHDQISYVEYVKRTFNLLRLCLRQAICIISIDANLGGTGNYAAATDFTGINLGMEIGNVDIIRAALGAEGGNIPDLDNVLKEFGETFEAAERQVLERYYVFFTMN